MIYLQVFLVPYCFSIMLNIDDCHAIIYIVQPLSCCQQYYLLQKTAPVF